MESSWEAIEIVWVKDDGSLVQGGGSLPKNLKEWVTLEAALTQLAGGLGVGGKDHLPSTAWLGSSPSYSIQKSWTQPHGRVQCSTSSLP